ncbi:hypothetical protein PS925_03671 [Pseudomonas fluorescens]|uniref:Uncharacterized protein n=1 Tax=Pseudomonas fluorescens TaxID=294 RepID=A0A5E7UPV5_PSEFL|nr:hypothetical protein [Pseudomonas fluorescens]VVQ12700.1 hypothetical protein PS925_03671 [Pseudomonas fluorescens]
MTTDFTNLDDFTDFTKAYWNGWSPIDGGELITTGDHQYYLNYPRATGKITKTITLESGKLYEFNFSYNTNLHDGPEITLSLGAEQLMRQKLPKTWEQWHEFEGLFKPKDTTSDATLSFSATDIADLDNIRIRLVPENELAAKMKKFDMQNSPKVV